MSRAVLAVLLIALAGCTEAPQPAPVLEAEPEPLPDLFGLVLDHDGERLAGATVAVSKLNLVSVTDVNGSFEFEAPPGTYTVEATRDGHRPASASIQVLEQLAAHVVFTLPTWDSLPAGVAVMEHRGFISCSLDTMAFGPDCPGDAPGTATDRFRVDLDFTIEPIHNVLLELFWDNGGINSPHLQAVALDEEGNELARSAGPSPLRFDAWGPAMEGLTEFFVEVEVGSGEAAALGVAQRYDAFASVFLNDPMPADYSIRS